jgi:hypothetical protein
MKVALGTGGPAVTSVAFAAGVNQLETAIRDTSAAAITYQRDALKKTFMEQYGPSIAQVMYKLCNVADNDHLPEVHRLLAQSPKGRAYAILGSFAEERAYASDVPLTASCLPLATTKMTDQVFRSFKPACTGVTIGEGLSPFACVCEGHAESQAVQLMIKKAEAAESTRHLVSHGCQATHIHGYAIPYHSSDHHQEALCLVSLHGHLPRQRPLAIGWHPVATNVRNFVKAVRPGLHVIYSQAAVPATGMDQVNSVLYEAQQDYFHWASRTARENRAAHHPAAPTFDKITNAVLVDKAHSDVEGRILTYVITGHNFWPPTDL